MRDSSNPAESDVRTARESDPPAAAQAACASYFASPERRDDDAIHARYIELNSDPSIVVLMNGFSEPTLLVDEHRQIVLANEGFGKWLEIPTNAPLGRRIGEVLSCVHAAEMPAGCGTSKSCAQCGASRSLVRALASGKPQVQECRITRELDHVHCSLDLRVFATPVALKGRDYVMVSIEDTTDEKRRAALERIFFHDVMNSAGGLQGLVGLLSDSSETETEDLQRELEALSGQLVEELQAQRDLAAAERGNLAVAPRELDARELLERVLASYRHHPVATGRSLEIGEIEGPASLRTDPVLLSRVLGNLIKNALEASDFGETVRVSCTTGRSGRATFSVWNQAVMPEAVQLQMFQRSFSTKGGVGRGLGSYSVRLLVEQYLKGSVAFVSEPGHGTTFRVELPAN